MNAKNVCARIVIQSADREARLALSSLRELRRYGRDVEMFIFPDEYHVKWQPAHRRATYLRSLDELERWSQSVPTRRSEEHTSELQSLMRISYAVFCLKKKKTKKIQQNIL